MTNIRLQENCIHTRLPQEPTHKHHQRAWNSDSPIHPELCRNRPFLRLRVISRREVEETRAEDCLHDAPLARKVRRGRGTDTYENAREERQSEYGDGFHGPGVDLHGFFDAHAKASVEFGASVECLKWRIVSVIGFCSTGEESLPD